MFIKINIEPDFDKTNYKKGQLSDYLFCTKWDFPDNIKSILDFNIYGCKIYTYEDLENMGIDHFSSDPRIQEAFLTKLLRESSLVLDDHGFDIEDFDEFKLHHLGLREIDNSQRRLTYEGNFTGDELHMDSTDWPIFAKIDITYIPLTVALSFYKELIGEGFLLISNDKENLGYFILYTALENFVNLELDEYDAEGNEQRERLSNKIQKLFLKQGLLLANNQVYTAIMPMLDRFRQNRNIIAHGKNRLNLTTKQINEALIGTMILILSIRSQLNTFNDLKGIIKSGQELFDF